MSRRKADANPETAWRQGASRLLRAQLVLRGFSYSELASKVSALGAHETKASIANKLSRGSFSCAFFLMCLHAIDTHQIDIPRGLRELEDGGSSA
jgi:hypothetical protein